MTDRVHTDPGVLELVGEIADLLGLAEHVQRLLPTQRIKVQRRHRRIEKLLDSFSEALSDSRAALRVLSTVLNEHLSGENVGALAPQPGSPDRDMPRIAFSVPRTELPVYRRGTEQLQAAIQKMTKIAFDLEASTSGVPEEVQRYYKISQSGSTVLRQIKTVLDDHPEALPELVRTVDSYLARCSEMLEERQRWLQA
jgi:NAD(P)-dependent dehydrogenase (short-subunit alcohol dehydrogenase family)